MHTELLAGLLGLAFCVWVVRRDVVPNLLRICTLGSGIALYVLLHEFYREWALGDGSLDVFRGNARVGLFVAAGLLIGTSVRFAMLPFAGERQGATPGKSLRGLPSVGVHVLVWIAGGVLARVFLLQPDVLRHGQLVVSRADLPLLLYCSMVLLAWVLWSLGQEYDTTLRVIVKTPEGKERDLQHRIDVLQKKAADAERQWAAAVIEERARRISAEQLAKQFASARKEKECLEPLSLREAFAVFGLPQGCSAETLRDAYRRLISQHHPDKVASLGPRLKEVAERETRRINAAFAMAIQFTATVSPNDPATQTPLRAIVCCSGVSAPNGFRRGST